MLPSQFGPGSPYPVYEQIQAALFMALESSEFEEQRFDGTRLKDPRLSEPFRWPSTLRALDSRCGGFPGVSYIIAPAKCGKSILALASALSAAATLEWRVVYLNAELTRSETAERVDRYIATCPGAEDALDLIRVVHVGRGLTLRRLHDELMTNCLEPDSMRLLVVVDSINRIADLCMGREYFRVLAEFSTYLMLARRISEGLVSALIVAEVNQRGVDKGDRGAYLSDMILRMKPDPQMAGWVNIEVPFARNGGAGIVGKFLRSWQEGCFLSEDQVYGRRPLRSIDGGAV